MKQFLKTVLACIVAIVACSIVNTFCMLMVIAILKSSYNSDSGHKHIKKGSVLEITLSENISDNPSQPPVSASLFTGRVSVNRQMALLDVVTAIETAATDNRIEAIYLNIDTPLSIGIASLSEIRKALSLFASSGKPIISYADSYSQGSYYLCSVSDHIYLNPIGSLEWQGMASDVIFFKGLLDKMDVHPQIIRHGRYKSAIEPFTETDMSQESRHQSEVLINSIWGNIVSEISASRNIDSALLQSYADRLSIYSSQKGVETGMIDSLLYRDQMNDMLASMLGENRILIPFADYVDLCSASSSAAGNRIEVIYAEGEIVDGTGQRGEVGSQSLCEALAEACDDDKVKSVVLRINSPGGSAMAADIIARQVSLLQKEKPVVVSMGDYAASGGYYIAAPADIICADRTTITGSIGVFGVSFDIGQALEDNLGVTHSTVKSNAYADMGSMLRPIDRYEQKRLQSSVDRTYDRFVDVVAEGRNLSRDYVDSIAQGRVWSGADAADIGLVDTYGGLSEAVLLAADAAGLDKYTITTRSNSQRHINMLLRLFADNAQTADDGIALLMQRTGERLRRMARANNKVMALMPFEIKAL